jgi:hypothetical protein
MDRPLARNGTDRGIADHYRDGRAGVLRGRLHGPRKAHRRAYRLRAFGRWMLPAKRASGLANAKCSAACTTPVSNGTRTGGLSTARSPSVEDHGGGIRQRRPLRRQPSPVTFSGCSATITAGTNPAMSPRRHSRYALRQANSNWLEIPCRRAVADASRGAEKLSSTIRSFSAADHRRRRPVSTISSRLIWRVSVSRTFS